MHSPLQRCRRPQPSRSRAWIPSAARYHPRWTAHAECAAGVRKALACRASSCIRTLHTLPLPSSPPSVPFGAARWLTVSAPHPCGTPSRCPSTPLPFGASSPLAGRHSVRRGSLLGSSMAASRESVAGCDLAERLLLGVGRGRTSVVEAGRLADAAVRAGARDPLLCQMARKLQGDHAERALHRTAFRKILSSYIRGTKRAELRAAVTTPSGGSLAGSRGGACSPSPTPSSCRSWGWGATLANSMKANTGRCPRLDF